MTGPGLQAGALPRLPIVNFDPQTDAAYIRLSDHRVASTNALAAEIIADFDAGGRLVGLEILDARRLLTPALLARLRCPATPEGQANCGG